MKTLQEVLEYWESTECGTILKVGKDFEEIIQSTIVYLRGRNEEKTLR